MFTTHYSLHCSSLGSIGKYKCTVISHNLKACFKDVADRCIWIGSKCQILNYCCNWMKYFNCLIVFFLVKKYRKWLATELKEAERPHITRKQKAGVCFEYTHLKVYTECIQLQWKASVLLRSCNSKWLQTRVVSHQLVEHRRLNPEGCVVQMG